MRGKTSRTVGWILFGIGALHMLGLGWLSSWRAVPATRETGPAYIFNLVGFVWALAAPLGSVLVLLGAALIAQVERRLFLAWSSQARLRPPRLTRGCGATGQ